MTCCHSLLALWRCCWCRCQDGFETRFQLAVSRFNIPDDIILWDMLWQHLYCLIIQIQFNGADITKAFRMKMRKTSFPDSQQNSKYYRLKGCLENPFFCSNWRPTFFIFIRELTKNVWRNENVFYEGGINEDFRPPWWNQRFWFFTISHFHSILFHKL